MQKVKFNRILANKHIRAMLQECCDVMGVCVAVYDASGNLLFGEADTPGCDFPVLLDDLPMGAVRGPEQAKAIASNLNVLVSHEFERRSLAREALDKYKEITLLYDLAERIATNLEPREVGLLVIDEALSLIKADNASVMLLTPQGTLEILAGGGKRDKPHRTATKAGEGVSGSVLARGRAEIVNDVRSDPRYIPGPFQVSSLICAPLKVKDRAIGVINLSTEQPHTYTSDELKLLSSLASQAAAAIENARLYDKLRETFFNTVNVLAETIEMRDPYTGGHTKRVRNLSVAIGEHLGFSEKELTDLRLAASLHDIGKIGINDSILRKPGRLTAEEYEHIKQHSEFGADILQHIDGLENVVPGVRNHHERYDGLGYPDGLKGMEIPTFARIIAVADTFDSMTSDRPYRASLSNEIALQELKDNAGTQFDPDMVEAFLTVYNQGNIE